MIQGRPLKLYTQIAYFLTDKNFCESDFIKLQKERYNITFDFENLKYEYETRIPFHKKLNSDIATLLEVSIAVNKIECEKLPDYSLFTMPALRALEGFIQQVLLNHTGEVINKTDKTIGCFFIQDKNNFVLKSEFRKGVLQSYEIISNAYDLYNKKRNNLFHVNTVTGETVFIRNQKDASDIVNHVLQVIHEGSELYL